MSQERDEELKAVTRLLASWREGDPQALNELFPIVYRELRALAHRRRRSAAAGDTMQTTVLVHEAYLKLVDQTQASIQDRHHFFALSSRIMRQVLVDASRSRLAQKRRVDVAPIAVDAVIDRHSPSPLDLLALDTALDRLAAVDERLCRIVELRVFSGLTVEETADVLSLSPRTVKREWRKARAFLFAEVTDKPAG
jgi:RNA polymerase sigma factor (TIGR02999 family)